MSNIGSLVTILADGPPGSQLSGSIPSPHPPQHRTEPEASSNQLRRHLGGNLMKLF